MSCPEEDFDQGGRFLLRQEHFRIFSNKTLYKFFYKAFYLKKFYNALTTTENGHPGPNPLQGRSYILQGFQKKVSGKLVKKSGRPSTYAAGKVFRYHLSICSDLPSFVRR